VCRWLRNTLKRVSEPCGTACLQAVESSPTGETRPTSRPCQTNLPPDSVVKGALVWLAIVAAVAVSGCGPGNPLHRQPISGEVTLDGEPLDRGRIKFRPQGSDRGIGSGDVIRDGRYAIPTLKGLPPGKYRVEINAPQEDTSPPPDDLPPGTPVFRVGIERIRARYHTESELSIDVSADGRNEFDFHLQADP